MIASMPAELEAAIKAARERCKRTVIVARFESVCCECRQTIARGAQIAWKRGGAAVHVECWQGELRT